ncbi:MAG: penicillin acylase family protein [Rhodothermus sp.]|nr:penicillin acylase family protein [Rhodothermus sp.]
MRRLLFLLILVLLGLLMIFSGYRYLVQAVRHPPSERIIAGLQAPVTLQILPGHLVSIQAAHLDDALTALGYAHGLWHSWPLLLWRQAALGRQSEWFGPFTVLLDSLVHALLLPEQSRTAYEQLPPHARHHLLAYTQGLQAALQERSTTLRDEQVLLNIPIESWQPWHSLAIERLLALLMLPRSMDDVLPGLSALRSWLHLYGFHHSMAWVRSTPDGALRCYMRYVYGDLALPFFQEVLIILPDDTLRLVTIPGTLLFLAGQTSQHTWYLLPTSQPATLERRPRTALSLQLVYTRFRLPDGSERLLQRARDGEALVLAEPGPNTVLLLRWAGLTPVSDLPAWLALLSNHVPTLRLFKGEGIRLTADGRWHLLGQPPIVEPLHNGILIGQTSWHQWIAHRLRDLPPTSALPDDAYSSWAHQQLATLLPLLDPQTFTDTLSYEAYTLLRNWDATYNAASLGATIFDYWISRYLESGGLLPLPTSPDPLRAPYVQTLRAAFHAAVDTLARRLGPDLNLWRWERAHPRRLAFPVWSHLTRLPAAARYAPLLLPGTGHPSTLSWGGSPLLRERPAPALWEGWTTLSDTAVFSVRRLWLEIDRFMARYRLPTQPSTLPLHPTPPLRSIRLIPR